jgi:tetratricopeptide (TPR) repeat protein
MGIFGRSKRQQTAPSSSASSGQADWILPKGLGWTVDDVYALEASGEWSEALKRWRQLLAPFQDPVIADKIRDMDSHRHIWLHIGLCARHVGDFDEALRAYGKAQELAQSAHDVQFALQVLNATAVAHRNAGRPDRAVEVLREALSSAAAQGDPVLTAAIHDNMAMAYVDQGRLEDALAEESTAFEILQAQQSADGAEVRARVQGNLSSIRSQLGLPE